MPVAVIAGFSAVRAVPRRPEVSTRRGEELLKIKAIKTVNVIGYTLIKTGTIVLPWCKITLSPYSPAP